MIAAIYARKSTEQGLPDGQKSVTRQIAHARAYAVQHEWTVDDRYVFVDDGISRAEFAKRRGYNRLMAALELTSRPPFQVLVMSEESRLGREGIDTTSAFKCLAVAGVRVFFYLEDREVLLGTFGENTMLFL